MKLTIELDLDELVGHTEDLAELLRLLQKLRTRAPGQVPVTQMIAQEAARQAARQTSQQSSKVSKPESAVSDTVEFVSTPATPTAPTAPKSPDIRILVAANSGHTHSDTGYGLPTTPRQFLAWFRGKEDLKRKIYARTDDYGWSRNIMSWDSHQVARMVADLVGDMPAGQEVADQ